MKKDPKGYLQDLIERIQRIKDYSQEGREPFLASAMIQDAVMRNFEIIGEIVKRLDKNFTDQHPHIPWRRIAGFRDVLIHDYEGVSMEVVWQVIQDDLPSLEAAIHALVDTMPPDDEDSSNE